MFVVGPPPRSFNVKIRLDEVNITFKLFWNLKKLNNKPTSFAVTVGKLIVIVVTDGVIDLIAVVSAKGKLKVNVVSVAMFWKPFKLFLFFNNKL